MALTPEQITANNFKDFYDLIRPYLNQATPIIEGAEFGKSDAYSTSVKMVGTWTDGKPVYQVVKRFDSPVSTSTWTKVLSMPSTTVFVDVKIYLTLANGIEITLPYNNSASYLLNSDTGINSYLAGSISMYVTDNSFKSMPCRAVIQYYRTNDPPILLGADIVGSGGGGIDNVQEGYLHNGSFYEDEDYTLEILGQANVIYIDKPSKLIYFYENDAYVPLTVDLSDYQTKLQFNSMPAASDVWLGKCVQFVGQTDSTYTHNYFYECVSDGGNPAVYSWEETKVQPGDESQYSVMPVASADLLGKVVQYTGATSASYTHNYFYECVSDGASTPVYSWEETKVQPGSSISSDGTVMPSRAVMNLIDHDVTDDSTNNKTDVAPHLLSSAELSDIIGTPPVQSLMPLVANAFQRANIFSTTEQMIGQWIDGKPLYQKTVDCGNDLAMASTVSVPHNILNLDNCVFMNGFWYSPDLYLTLPRSYSGNFWFDINVNATNVIIISGAPTGASFLGSYVTLRYTKTTDTAIEIGTADDYSTTEKIVGTWLDGKPIYQIIISTDTSWAPTTTGITIPAITSLNIDVPILIRGFSIDTPSASWTRATTGALYLVKDSGSFKVVNYATNPPKFNKLLIQYTKATN